MKDIISRSGLRELAIAAAEDVDLAKAALWKIEVDLAKAQHRLARANATMEALKALGRAQFETDRLENLQDQTP